MENVRIPRCYYVATPAEIPIHAFSDASEHAHSAVVVLKSYYTDGRIQVRLVASKAKVASLTKQSILRSELLATLSLARLVNKVKLSIGGIQDSVY